MPTFHLCMLDSHCRQYGAPNRLQISFKRGTLFIGFTPGSRIQGWLPGIGYLQGSTWYSWWPVVWHPK